MPIRPTLPLAAALLAGLAAPVAAQDRYDPGEPPPLPELPADEWSDWDAPPADDYRDAEDHAALAHPAQRLDRAFDPRAAWLSECRARLSPARVEAFDRCEAHLLDYERAFADHGGRFDPRRGPDVRAMGPVIWVKVPIVRERRHGCANDTTP